MPRERPGPLMKAFLFISAAWIALPILVLQNLLGMYMNLWLDFSKYSNVPAVFTSFPTIDFHVAVGILILIVASGRVATALAPNNRPFLIPSVFIFIFAVLAFASGVEFTFFGRDDAFSFTMELGFGGILVSVGALLYVAAKMQRKAASPSPRS